MIEFENKLLFFPYRNRFILNSPNIILRSKINPYSSYGKIGPRWSNKLINNKYRIAFTCTGIGGGIGFWILECNQSKKSIAFCQSIHKPEIDNFDKINKQEKIDELQNKKISIWTQLWQFLEPDVFWLLISIPVSSSVF